MFDNNILMTLISLILGIVAVNHITNQDKKTKEGFLGTLPSMQVKVDRVAAPNKQAAAKGDFYSVPGTYQAILNPRFSNVDYGANIRYNMPSYKNQAAPSNPLTFNSMVRMGAQNYPKENYTNSLNSQRENYTSRGSAPGGSVASCRKDGTPTDYSGGAPLMKADYSNGNYNEQLNAVYSQSDFPAVGSSLPVGDMTSLNANNDDTQPIVYDRYMYANRNSRLRGQGDMIRGDLAIVPCSTGWFQVSVQPNLDLQQGAMNVLAGVNNEQGKSLSSLIYRTSGNSETTIAGVDYSKEVNMSTMFGGGLSSGQTDVNVTAFP